MQPKGANKNIVDQAIFSKDGPNLNSPEATKIPSVIPKIYRLKKEMLMVNLNLIKIFQIVEKLAILLAQDLSRL